MGCRDRLHLISLFRFCNRICHKKVLDGVSRLSDIIGNSGFFIIENIRIKFCNNVNYRFVEIFSKFSLFLSYCFNFVFLK